MILNLFINAFQSMHEEGTVKVVTYEDKDKIIIEIQDEGVGVPEQIKDKLFEPFFTTKEEGIGLGLSIVKRIIDDHKGSIQIKDNFPKGTIFKISLPKK